MRHLILLAAASTALLSACNTIPEPEPEPVVIDMTPIDTCTPVSALTRVVVPAVTETRIAITEIDNAPYEPIQKREEMVRIVEPERTIFVDSEGREVTDICDAEINPSGMTEGG